MPNLPPTDTERITSLEQLVQFLTGRVDALETREAQREAGLLPNDVAALTQHFADAAAGSKDADSLNHFE